ncbi:MAG: Glycosyl hydrolase, family 18, partial [Microgenomates group bacterium Gr01-1014_93]
MEALPDQNELKMRYELEKVYNQDQKLSSLEKIVKVEFFVNIIVGLLILAIMIFVVFWRLDLLNLLGKQVVPVPDLSKMPTTERVVVAVEKEQTPVFISEQSVDIDKAFQADSGSIRLTSSGNLKREVFGFLPYWVMTRLDEINLKLLTTVSYFGLEVDKDGEIIKYDSNGKMLSPWFYFQSGPIFDNFIKKAHSEKIKVQVTLKCFNQSNIISLVTSQSARKKFIDNAIFLVNSRGLDGVNIDFEYIGEPSKEVRDGFSSLVIELNTELKRQNPNASLTIDTFVDAASNTRIHDPEILSKNSDVLVIMGYDFHTPESSLAGPVAPMEGYGNSIVGLLGSYLDKVPAEK